MANAPFKVITDYRDIEALRFYAEATERGDDLAVLLLAMAKMSRDLARTPVAVGRLPGRRLHRRHALAGRQPRPRDRQRGRPGRRPRLGLRPLPPPDRAAPRGPGGHRRRLRAPPPRAPRRSGPSSAAPPRPSSWSRPTSPPTWRRRPAARRRLGRCLRRADQPARRPAAVPARPEAPPLGVRRLAPRPLGQRLPGVAPAAVAGMAGGGQASWLSSAYRDARARLTADSMLSSWFCSRRSCGSTSACSRWSCGPMSAAIVVRR